MVKAYLRYEPAASFGVIVSGESNIAYDSSGKHLLAPALEKIGIWHVRQSLCTKTLAPFPSSNSKGLSLAVTSIASSSSFHALPFSDALELLSYLEGWASVRDKVELVCRVGVLLVQLHYHQLISTVSARPLITRLCDILPARAKECKDTLGFNLAAMDHSKQLLSLWSDALSRDKKTKLLEIRSHNVKRTEARVDTKQEKKRKKKQKKSDGGHVWS